MPDRDRCKYSGSKSYHHLRVSIRQSGVGRRLHQMPNRANILNSYGQTTVADSPLGLQTETNNGITATFIAYSPSFTWTGPTVVSITTTQDLLDYGQANIPGLRCGAVCGNCALVFPTVSVLYFPTASPDTACLSTLTQGNHSFTGFGKRGVTSLEGSGSTLVNDEGFTFTSPSVYVVFPTISATDSCGKVGSVHTSTTLAFAPGKLSTAALGKSGLVYSSFDFKYVSCPPSDGNTLLYSIIGQTGYNPIISASSIGLQVRPLNSIHMLKLGLTIAEHR